MSAVRIEFHEWTSWPEIRATWLALANRVEEASFFLSEMWVTAWMDVFGASLKPQILTFHCGSETVGAALLVRRIERRALLPVVVIHLNTAGEGAASPFIEHNGLLAPRAYRPEVARALRDYLRGCYWDELAFDGVGAGEWPAILAGDAAVRVRSRPSYFVDLEALRAGGTDYVATLSPRTRARVRQSIRAYETDGPIAVTAARTRADADAALEGLMSLHQNRWHSRGEPGAFAETAFVAFQRRLIAAGAGAGVIDLLRVSAGDTTIGYLYNFVHRARVFFYQCGFVYSSDRRLQPGMVALSAAVRWYAAAGMREFDFSAGDPEYKRALGHASRPVEWLRVEGATAKMRVIVAMRTLKHLARPA